MFTSSNTIGEDFVCPTESLTNPLFFYIGDTTFFYQAFHLLFSNCQHASDFSVAKELLPLSTSLPELFIIDIPLNKADLIAFKSWLRTHHYQTIPVIYNQTALNSYDIKQLFRMKLVDDVVNVKEHYNKLSYKINFIQKTKSNNSQPPKQYFKQLNERLTWLRQFSLGQKLLDIFLSAATILFFVPLFVLIAIVIKCDSKGPVIYHSNRAGRGYRVFKFYKFRTMILDADKKVKELEKLNQYNNNGNSPTFFKVKDDPRVTRVGAFLRKTSLDELPQLFNVLIGDMSIVGNRPLPLYEASSLTTNEWAERFMAPAGITGLWQVSKRGKAEMSNEERILLDINYARTRSLKGDLKILIQTPTALIQKSNV